MVKAQNDCEPAFRDQRAWEIYNLGITTVGGWLYRQIEQDNNSHYQLPGSQDFTGEFHAPELR